MSDELIDVCILGDGGVGKTSITLQYIKGEFTEAYIPTIEDEFQKIIQIDGKTYKIEIVDTAGQEDFKDLRTNYIKLCHAFMLIYAVDDESSLDSIQELYDDIIAVHYKLPPTILLGNKCDLPQPFAVDISKAKQKSAKKWNNIEVMETSAKLNKNITEAFEYLVRKVKGLDKVEYIKPQNDSGCCNIQ